jgi:hypothetical protein
MPEVEIEEPLEQNSQVYAFNEKDGVISLCDFRVHCATRERFVIDSRTEGASTTAMHSQACERANHYKSATVFIVFNASDPNRSSMQTRVLERRLRSAGYLFLQVGSLMVGEIKLNCCNQVTLPPACNWGECGWFIGFGMAQGELVALPALLPTLQVLATTRRLYPSKEFITEITSKGAAFMYGTNETSDDEGWIFIRPRGRSR